jgi:hypothetical protein
MAISEAEFKNVTSRGEATRARGPIVVSAICDATARTLALRFSNDATITIPIDAIEGLAQKPDAKLAHMAIESAGLSLHWPRLDVSLWVPSLVDGITGSRAWMATIAAMSEGARGP